MCSESMREEKKGYFLSLPFSLGGGRVFFYLAAIVIYTYICLPSEDLPITDYLYRQINDARFFADEPRSTFSFLPILSIFLNFSKRFGMHYLNIILINY